MPSSLPPTPPPPRGSPAGWCWAQVLACGSRKGQAVSCVVLAPRREDAEQLMEAAYALMQHTPLRVQVR